MSAAGFSGRMPPGISAAVPLAAREKAIYGTGGLPGGTGIQVNRAVFGGAGWTGLAANSRSKVSSAGLPATSLNPPRRKDRGAAKCQVRPRLPRIVGRPAAGRAFRRTVKAGLGGGHAVWRLRAGAPRPAGAVWNRRKEEGEFPSANARVPFRAGNNAFGLDGKGGGAAWRTAARRGGGPSESETGSLLPALCARRKARRRRCLRSSPSGLHPASARMLSEVETAPYQHAERYPAGRGWDRRAPPASGWRRTRPCVIT